MREVTAILTQGSDSHDSQGLGKQPRSYCVFPHGRVTGYARDATAIMRQSACSPHCRVWLEPRRGPHVPYAESNRSSEADYPQADQ